MEAIEEALTTQPEPTLREQLAENLAAATESETPPESTTPKPTDGSEAVVADAPEGRTAGRARDESGRLLPGKAQKDAAVQTPDPAKAGEPLTLTTPAPTAPKRPSTWGKDTWPIYDKLAAGLPLTAQEAKTVIDTIHKREGDFANGVSTYKQEFDRVKPLDEAVAPYRDLLKQHNMDEGTAVRNLLNTQHALTFGQPQQKVDIINNLIAEYKLPIKVAYQDNQGQWQLLAAQQQPQQQPQQPQFRPEDIQRLVRQELIGERTQQTIAEFERNAPEHYATVKQDMAGLLQAGLAQDLQDAYDTALRLPKHAEIFNAMQQQQREQDDAKAKAVQQQKVVRARANAVSTSSATPSGNMAQAGDKSLRDQLTENLRQVAGGRV